LQENAMQMVKIATAVSNGMGALYDPNIVEAFLKTLYENTGAYKEIYRGGLIHNGEGTDWWSNFSDGPCHRAG
jgi:hypothetical protein